MYQYYATIIRIVDGDTVECNIDLGLKIYFKCLCRLAGINAPELNSIDPAVKAKAFAAKDYLATLLALDSTVLLDSKRLDKYGRPISEITSASGINVNQEMVKSGNAVIYK